MGNGHSVQNAAQWQASWVCSQLGGNPDSGEDVTGKHSNVFRTCGVLRAQKARGIFFKK